MENNTPKKADVELPGKSATEVVQKISALMKQQADNAATAEEPRAGRPFDFSK